MNPFEPPVSETEEQKEQAVEYRRKYWQQYKMRKPRIYGTVSQAQYTEIQQLAHNNGRSIWAEVWQQSLAYRKQAFLPSVQIQQEIEKLYAELRRINDNLSRISERSAVVRTLLQRHQISQQLEAMENAIETFSTRPWGKSS